jgi:hypothetical protein
LTLSSFKNNSKFIFIISVLIIYGGVAYVLGATGFLPKFTKFQNELKVKGTADKKAIQNPIDSPVPFSDSQSTSIESSMIKHCSNTKLGFEVVYPQDWFTTYNTDDQKCTYFAPYTFTVPQTTDNFSVPIKVEPHTPDEWPGVIKFYENPNDFQNVISTQNIEINGKAVEKITALTTGTGLAAKGLQKMTYLYLDTDLPLVFSYQQVDAKEDAGKYEKILEDMVRSVQYF